MRCKRLIELGACLTVLAGEPIAYAQAREIDIPAQELGPALRLFARQTGLRPVYADATVRGVRTDGVAGAVGERDALAQLLAGTGLGYKLAPGGKAVSIVLAQAAMGTQSDAGAVALPEVSAEAEAGAGRAPGSSQTGAGLGGRFTGYNVTGPAVSSKTDIPILQSPFSVQVVPREVIDDQQDISIKDAIANNISSVQAGGDQFFDSFIIRGFDVGWNIYRDNLRTGRTSNTETVNLQSIEVLKGPAAMLFGRIEPGGLVNLVTKRPLLTPYYSIQQQAGSFGVTRTTVDATGPLTEDKTLAYRVNLAYLNADSFRDFVYRQNVFVAPSVSYQPIEQFRLNIDGEYQNLTFVTDPGTSVLPAIGARPANIPISRYLNAPSITRGAPSRQERGLFAYNWTFDIAQDWSVVNRLAYIDTQSVWRFTDMVSIDEITGLAQRRLTNIQNDTNRILTANLDLNGKFVTGPFQHAVLVGTDYLTRTRLTRGFDGDSPVLGPINIYFPAYSEPGLGFTPDNLFAVTRETWKGIYAQDQISFADNRLHFLVGGRYDWAEQGNGYSPTSFSEANGIFDAATFAGFRNSYDQAFSPRLGAVVQPLPWLSFYGNFSQSFGETNALPFPGQPLFQPQKGTQYEGGAKAEFFDARLTATMAFYDIIKTNILASVPGSLYSIPVGTVRSKGVEFDIAGRISENWSLIGSFSHDDARIANDSAPDGGFGNLGNRVPNVPLNAGNLWVKYDADGDFRGLSLGAGVNVVGERQGDPANTFRLPGYAVANGMIMYRLQPVGLPWVKNLTAQLNVRNLFNTTYYESSSTRFNIYPGAPRAFLLSLRAEF